MPEISEAELSQLRRSNKLLESLVADPAKGLDYQRALKEKDPTLKFAALDIADTVTAPLRQELTEHKTALQKIQEEREAERLAAVNAKQESTLRDSIGAAQAKYKLTKESTDKLVEFMVEKGIGDAMIAAPAFMETLPKPPAPQPASQYMPQFVNPFGTGDVTGSDPNIEFLHKDPIRWQDAETLKILNEPTAEAA